MQLQLPVRTEQECKRAFQKIPEATIDSRVLCAGYAKGGRDACQVRKKESEKNHEGL